MSPLLTFEVIALSFAVIVSLVFAIWRICSDVRKIREHFDRVDRREAQKLGYSPRPAAPTRRPPTDPNDDTPGWLKP